MTRPNFLRGAITALVLMMVAGAWRPVSTQQTLALAPESKLWFDGKSTVKDWSYTAPAIQAVLETVAFA